MCTVHVHGGVAPGKCRGSEEVGGPVKPIAVAGGLRVGLQVSVKHVRHICIRTYMKESLPGSLYSPVEPGQGS